MIVTIINCSLWISRVALICCTLIISSDVSLASWIEKKKHLKAVNLIGVCLFYLLHIVFQYKRVLLLQKFHLYLKMYP